MSFTELESLSVLMSFLKPEMCFAPVGSAFGGLAGLTLQFVSPILVRSIFNRLVVDIYGDASESK